MVDGFWSVLCLILFSELKYKKNGEVGFEEFYGLLFSFH